MPDVDIKPEELMAGVLSKFAHIITGNTEGEPIDPNNFVAWLTPGMVIKQEFFDFANRIYGDSPSGSTGGGRERESTKLANEWAILANYVPSGSPLRMSSNLLQTRYDTSQELLWNVFKEVLLKSQVAKANLSDEEKSKLKDYQTKLNNQGPLWKTYFAKKSAFLIALEKFNSAKANFNNATSPEAVSIWRYNGKILKEQVLTALAEWENDGQKNTVEQMQGEIQQLTQRNLVVIKKEIQDNLNLSVENGFSEFYPTSITPSDILHTEEWPEFEFSENDFSSIHSQESSDWGGGGSLSVGLWNVGADVHKSTASSYASLSNKGFKLKFKFTQAQIVRGDWFNPGFLVGRGWKWAPGFEGADLSDGKIPPSGRMVAYPTTVLLARDISVYSHSFESDRSTYESHLSAGGSIGWGPFSIGGHYKHDEAREQSNWHFEDGGLHSDGIQIIGFSCHLLGKSPDPLENAQYE